MRFELLAGSHWHQEKLHAVGAIIETDMPLDTTFPGRFEVVAGTAEAVQTASETQAPEQKTRRVVRVKVGSPVSDSFAFDPKATGLQVFKRGSKYFVCDEVDLETPLNKKGLAKAQVLSFIESQCEG